MDGELITILVGGLAVVGGLVALLIKQRGGLGGGDGSGKRGEPTKPGSKSGYKTRGAEALIKEGRAAEAAALAMGAKHYEEAMELYRIADQPAAAAHAARRANKPKQAAELFEMAGDLEQAAVMWHKAGVYDRALTLRRGNEAEEAGDDDEQPTALDEGIEAEVMFRRAQAKAQSEGTLDDDDDGSSVPPELQDKAREAADKLLAAGEMRRAAEVLRDAGLYAEAIHLFVNVLGTPGEAAPLLAKLGNRERAADLYEMAGELERAAREWAKVAADAPAPAPYLDRIEQLSKQVMAEFLRDFTRGKAPTPDNADLHYRLARACADIGEHEAARTVYGRLTRGVGVYKDVAQRIAALPDDGASSAAAAAVAAPATPAAAPATPAQRAPVSADADTTFNPAQALAPDSAPLDSHEVMALVHQASRRAASHIKVIDVVQQTAPTIVVINRQTRRGGWWGGDVPLVVQTGVELQPVQLDPLLDEAVLATQQGPSVVSLLKYIKGKPCDLSNIEVYYRLGLSYLAKGMWSQARDAFEQVEQISPGYRDADRRATTIGKWQSALGERRTTMGDAGTKGRYVLEGELGRGGMAVVYRAHDRVLGRDVALKFMAESVSQQQSLRDMFQREARAAASLNHPNIVTIYDFGMMEGRAFISMELVDGVPVDQLQGELTIVESVEIARQALKALACAHERDIIHRDIKPANMMRTRAGLVKLMDFGLAKPLDPNAKRSIVAGTPAFMPPEQLAGADMDCRVDVFAMGVTLYEMLTGELPYIGMDRDAAPRRPKEHTPDVPDAVDEAVMCAISADREDRFASALSFAASLGRVMDAVRRFSSAPPAMD